MAQSLFRACKNVIRNGSGSVQNVGGYDVGIEYYTQEDIDENVRKIKFGEASKCTFGDNDESKVVLVASPEITIPAGFTLTPVSPKKSLVIMCNTLVNEGTISMTGKGPNVLPHEWYIVGGIDGYADNVIVPAYANNSNRTDGRVLRPNHGYPNPKNGIARQCGSGGMGTILYQNYQYYWDRFYGSGYAFGGGAGSGSTVIFYINEKDISPDTITNDVNETYPMRGSGVQVRTDYNSPVGGGVGNPSGSSFCGFSQSTGVGGRIIIFCNTIINNKTISANGVSTNQGSRWTGGASGGGAVDIFATDLSNLTNIPTATGGKAYSEVTGVGDAGNGSVTLSDGDQAPLWVMPNVFKPRRKKFTKDNWTYLFGEYVDRLNQEV